MKFFLSCFFSVAIALSSFAQTTLKGTLKDASNAGIAQATIRIQGQEIYATSNNYGEFTLKLTDGYETITITAQGYKTQTIYLTGQTQLDITLQKETIKKDVVNVGFGTQSKEDLTSSVSTVDASDISISPLINLEQANQGTTAGLFVQNSSGALGQPTQVRIRGGSSLSASNQPLYVVDGVPLTSGNQSNINPSNIATLEILKDASATAIYGTRAANGVIIITTKSGTSGKMQVNVDYQFGISETPKKLDIQSGAEHRLQTFEFIVRGFDDFASTQLFEPVIQANGSTFPAIDRNFLEQVYNSGISSITFAETFAGGRDLTFNIPGFYDNLRDLNANTDWQDEVFRTAISHRANVDFQGGSDALGYFTSFGYSTQEGILIGNSFDRFNGSLSLNSKITEKLKANLNINYIFTEDDRLSENQDLGFPLQAIALPPSDYYDPSNDYRLLIRTDYNPLTEVNNSSNIAKNNSILGSLGLNYKFSDQLSFDINGGIDQSDLNEDRFQSSATQDGAGSPTGRTRISEQILRNSILNGWLTFSKDIENNSLSIIAGGSYQNSTSTFTFSDTEFPNTEPFPESVSAFLSGYTRISYSLGDQFDFQVSGRLDGSSKFSEANRFGFFPAVSAGWQIQNAPFFNVESFSLLKLRASYGLVGNTPQDDFLYRRNYFRSTRYGSEASIELSNLANDELKWETTAQLNFGVDFAILNDRINASIDYYQKTTTDLLFPVPVTATSGFSQIFDNIGEMKNTGFEFNISTTNVQTTDFSWTTDFNISSNKNEIIDLKGEQATIGVNAFRKGQPAGVFFMRDYAGVDFDEGKALYFFDIDPNSSLSEAQQINEADAYRIDDRFGEQYVTQNWDKATRRVVGDPNPDLFGGLTNSISYKSFEFSFMFQFVSGVDLYFQTGEFLSNSGILNLGQTADQSNRWYAPGDEAPYPVLNPFSDFPESSSRWLSDGSYVRLKNITLTYNFPSSMLSKMKVRNMSVYVAATNLLTFTNYIGYDPDVSYFDPLDGIIGQNISRGIDNFNTPQPRIIMTGIKIGL